MPDTAPPLPPPPPELTAALAGTYRVDHALGAGGMATVYLAQDLRHDRPVALKVLRPELAAVIGAERFLNEVRITARLEHPHIATLIDSGESDGFLWYVLPYVRGESLRQRLDREGPLPIHEALALAHQLARALDHAHAQDVVHRDIKPENILLHDGEALLVDFGIALAVKEAGGNRLTETGLSLGTPQYMSPEQATGARGLDARSDVYSLASVLYEMLAGEPPHTAPTVQGVIAKLLTERPTRLRVVRETVPEGVDAAVAKALAKTPADRFSSAGAFWQALEHASRAVDPPPARRRGRVVALVAGALVVVAAVAWLVSSGSFSRGVVPPQVMQVTTTGTSWAGSLSPDGQRIAYANRECTAENDCSMSVQVRDVSGAGIATLLRGMLSVWSTAWSDDGRYLLIGAQASNGTWGVYSVPSLGGDPRFLGCCTAYYVGGDTILANVGNPQDSVSLVRWMSLVDGSVYRELRTLHPARSGPHFLPFGGDRLLLVRWAKGSGTLFVTDTAGTPADSTRIGPVPVHFIVSMPSEQVALVAAPRSSEQTTDLLAYHVNRSGRFSVSPDTLIRRWSHEGFTVSHGGVLAYASGRTSYESVVLTRESVRSGTFTPRPLAAATVRVMGVIDRAGERVAVARMTAAEGAMRQLSVVDLTTGAERAVGPPSELLGFEWTVDGSALLLRVGKGADSTELRRMDPRTGAARVLHTVPRENLNYVETMRGGGYMTLSAQGDSLWVFDVPWGRDTAFVTPERWMRVASPTASPDGREILFASWDAGGDSVTYHRMSLVDGSVERVATMWGDGWGRPAWLPDGSMVLPLLEGGATMMLYSADGRGGKPELLGPAPRQRAGFSWSADGRSLLANVADTRPDIFLVTNFLQVLRGR